MTLATGQPPLGIQPDHQEGEFIARSGNVCEGYCYPLCLLQASAISTDGETISVHPGGTGSMWASVSALTNQAANEGRDGRWVLALESALDLGKFRGLVKGIGRAVCAELSNTTLPRGRKLWAAGPNAGPGLAAGAGYHLQGQALTGTGGVAKACIAQALETISSTPSDGALIYVYFDGFDGVNLSGETQ